MVVSFFPGERNAERFPAKSQVSGFQHSKNLVKTKIDLIDLIPEYSKAKINTSLSFSAKETKHFPIKSDNTFVPVQRVHQTGMGFKPVK
jgi:hypothetical protein